MSHASVVIYPAHNRSASGEAGKRCLHTFERLGHSPLQRFETLRVVNDEMLGPGLVNEREVRPDRLSILVPLEGALELQQGDVKRIIDVGSFAVFTTGRISAVRLQNAYDLAWINYLEIQIESPPAFVCPEAAGIRVLDFNLIDQPNKLVSFNIHQALTIHLGRYQGRVDATLSFLEGKNVFAFVIDGIGEVNNRLLDARDGLALPNCRQVSFESLSPESVFLFIEGL